MKHQITFVGGQLLPIYLGIKERDPDKIHLIVSSESKNKIGVIKSLLKNKQFSENICDPYDFFSIKKTCENILKEINPQEEVEVNLTGGTKIMLLAAQAVLEQYSVRGFYANQNHTLLQVPGFKLNPIQARLTIKEFIHISGHQVKHFKTITDFTLEDFTTAEIIRDFAAARAPFYSKLTNKLRKAFEKSDDIPVTGNLTINETNKIYWTIDTVRLTVNNTNIFSIQSPNARQLFFNTAWWELLTAREIAKWSKAEELIIQAELPFKTDNKISKNEIDILVNTGSKLIFIECKSGLVKQDDVNKMKIVKDTYGGEISKSMLVCRFRPSPTISEKCKELGIEIFTSTDSFANSNSLRFLFTALERLNNTRTL